MYSKEEARRLREQFWTSFGQYMSAVPSADGEKVNWVNYKTGVKHLFFKMDVSNKKAIILIEITTPDSSMRELIYAQFVELRSIFESTVAADWEWDERYYDDNGKEVSRISCTLDKVSVFNQSNWPELISFFKPRIIALDEFWSLAKYKFDIFK